MRQLLQHRIKTNIVGRTGHVMERGQYAKRFIGEQAIVLDTFTDTNGVLIENHAPEIGGPWVLTVPDTGTPTAGSITIQNNKAAISLSNEGAVVDAGISDADISLTYTAATGARSGILMRSVSDGNTLSFRVRPADGEIDLLTWTSGVASADAVALFTFVNGQDYTLRVRCVGSTVLAYIDGNQVLSATVTAHQTGTRYGFTSYGSSLAERYDNFVVYEDDYLPVQANFDGISALSRTILTPSETNEGTVSLWAFIPAGAANQKLYDIGDGASQSTQTTRLRIDGASLFDSIISHYTGTEWEDIASVSNIVPKYGTMEHIFMTYKNDLVDGPGTQIMQIWVDGQFAGSDVSFFPNNSITTSFILGDVIVIGARHNGLQPFTGKMAEIVTYNAYIDPATNINKFFDPTPAPGWPNGRPVSIGIDGIVNGLTPDNYLGGLDYDIDDWNAGENRGNSADFTLVGGPITE